jgi:hypothetical protein
MAIRAREKMRPPYMGRALRAFAKSAQREPKNRGKRSTPNFQRTTFNRGWCVLNVER